MNTQTITLENGKYINVPNNKKYDYLGYNISDWKGPCIYCGGNNFSIYIYPSYERKYQHFCSGGCAICFDPLKPQSKKAREACQFFFDSHPA